MNTGELKELLHSEGIHPNKKLGQNFLVNRGMVQRIIDSCSLESTDRVLEIGPGAGALTGLLEEKAAHVTAVEIDAGLVRLLRKRFNDRKNLDIMHGDILKTGIPGDVNRVVGNLPYYCSSEILFRVAAREEVTMGCFMLQKEMAQRMAADPGESNYGALTVNLKLYFDVEYLFNIDRQSFFPQPDVTSTFVRLTRIKTGLNEEEKKLFHELVRSAFWGRRKTIKKALSDSPHLDWSVDDVAQLLELAGYEETARGETLETEDFMLLARAAWDMELKHG
mgnify:CR=1 FL=1